MGRFDDVDDLYWALKLGDYGYNASSREPLYSPVLPPSSLGRPRVSFELRDCRVGSLSEIVRAASQEAERRGVDISIRAERTCFEESPSQNFSRLLSDYISAIDVGPSLSRYNSDIDFDYSYPARRPYLPSARSLPPPISQAPQPPTSHAYYVPWWNFIYDWDWEAILGALAGIGAVLGAAWWLFN